MSSVVTRYWLIYFEDKERGPEMFSEETAARDRYDRLKDSWNCHLFAQADPVVLASAKTMSDLRAVEQDLKEELEATIHLADDGTAGLSYVDGMMKAIQIVRRHAANTKEGA